MTQALSGEEKLRLKKQWTDLSIRQAQEGQWGEAALTNKNILNYFPQDPEAYNRLGKALSELGQYSEARQAYSQTLKYSPTNTIAKKNLDRLQTLQEDAVAGTVGVDRVDPRLFIEEAGKTGITELINLGPAPVLSRIGVGDRVNLIVDGHRLLVRSAAQDTIGQVEPRLAARLIGYVNGGNRYVAGVLTLDINLVRLFIREEYQHPSLFGTVSFPSRGSGDTVRAYIKDSILRHDRDDDDDMSTDDEYYDGGDDTEDMNEFEFEGSPDIEE